MQLLHRVPGLRGGSSSAHNPPQHYHCACRYVISLCMSACNVTVQCACRRVMSQCNVHVGMSNAGYDVNERTDGLLCKCGTCSGPNFPLSLHLI